MPLPHDVSPYMKRSTSLFLLACALSLAPACGGAVNVPTSPTTTSCDLTIAPASQAVTPDGGSFHTRVSGGCAWNATTDENWIAVTFGEGTSLGTVTYTVTANAGVSAREGRVRIGEEVLQVVQEGLPAELPVARAARAGTAARTSTASARAAVSCAAGTKAAPAPPAPAPAPPAPAPAPPAPAPAPAPPTTACTSDHAIAGPDVQVPGVSLQPVGDRKGRRLFALGHHGGRLQMVGVVFAVVDRRPFRQRRG